MLTQRTRKWGTLALCLLAIAAVLFAASLFVPAYGEICDKNEYSGAKECAAHHVGPFLLLWIGQVIDRHEALITALATIAIAGFTWTLKRSTDRLWEAGETQRRDNRRSIFASLHTAQAAKKQARIAEESLMRLERPYVFIEKIRFLSEVNERPTIAVVFRNYGRTPASLAACDVWFRVLDHTPTEKDEPISSDGTPVELERQDLEVMMAPDRPWQTPDIGTRDVSRLREIPNGYSLYLWGFLRYRDMFDNIHPTFFCRIYRPDLKQWLCVGGRDRNYGE